MTRRTRLRQAVIVAAHQPAPEPALGTQLGLHDPFYDPSIIHFGLTNAVFTVGDTFLEVISPAREGTTAGRYRERIGGDGGYMATFQVPDIDDAQKRLIDLDVRVVFDGSHPDIADLHLHPRDVPGAIVASTRPGRRAPGASAGRPGRPRCPPASSRAASGASPCAARIQRPWPSGGRR